MASTRRRRRSSPNAKRGDIQGLRAIAVIVVLLDHLVSWPPGGFVGVDIFFVISGFLITGLLLRERATSGSISLVAFYRRRVRRIAPAASVVLAITIVASFVVFTSGRALQTLWDALWSLLFVSNWRFAASGTDYFQAEGAVSPLQHFWSLGVEEQFYFVWPWLILLILVVESRSASANGRRALRAAGVALGLLVVASFAYAVWETSTNPTWAYFSSVSRAWELGAGALLAVFATRLEQIPDRVRPFIAWLGVATILASVLLITTALPFPGPWALPPVIGTVLVIAAGTGGRQRYLAPLTNRVAGWLGNISYSLYLWHFPVIVILAAVSPKNSAFYVVFSLLFTFAFASVSYYFIEQPILKSRWLSGRSKARPSKRKSSAGLKIGKLNAQTATLVGSLIVVTALVVTLAFQNQHVRQDQIAAISVAVASNPSTPQASYSPLERDRQSLLTAALSIAQWPKLTPDERNLPNAFVSEWVTDGCLGVEDSNEAKCRYGNGQHVAVVVGDSHAISYMPAIRTALSSDWTVQSLTLGQCPLADVNVTKDGVEFSGCDAHRKWVLDQIAAMKPELILWTDSFNTVRRIQDSAGDVDGRLREGTATMAENLASLATDVVFVPSPPPSGNLQDCRTNFSSPASCVNKINDEYLESVAAQRLAIQAAPKNVSFAEVTDWFCVDGFCPAFVDGVAQFVDGYHLTAPASVKLGALLGEAIDRAAPGVVQTPK